MSEVRLPRRRRSAARTPVVVNPADIPEDAMGRVEVLAVRAPADVYDPADRPAQSPPPASESSRLVEVLLTAGGWAAVGAVAGLVLVLFVVGMLLTR